MELHSNVYFQRFGEYTYLRHVEQRKDYLFNDIAYDILSYIKNHPGCTAEQICAALLNAYEVTEKAELEHDVRVFADDLLESEIILPGNILPGKRISPFSREESIRDFIQEMCCENHLLLNVCLELTYRCNERCIHCYVDDPSAADEELKFQDYKIILDELRGMGCMGVLITGGEPSLHPDFLSIVSYAEQIGLLVDIYTNGLAADNELLDQLIALKPNSISFSFYGGTAKVHDSITGIAGSFEKSLRTMMICKCSGIDTYMKTVVMKQNVNDYEELLKLGKRLGIPVVSSLSVMPGHKGKNADQFRLMNQDAYQAVLELEYKYHLYSPDQDMPERVEYICASGLNTLSIDPFGYIHPCNASPVLLGNVKQESIKRIWEESQSLHGITEMKFDQLSESCSECPDKSWCGICLGSALRENGKPAPCADSCMIAYANHKAYINQKKRGETNETDEKKL